MDNNSVFLDTFMNDDSTDVDNRTFYIQDEIDMQMTVGSIIKSINSINANDDKQEKLYALDGHVYNRKPIKLYISSYGGSVYSGLALVGVITTSKTPIHTIANGMVMSMGFILALSGHKRFTTPFTTFMMHSVSSVAWGNLKEMEESVEQTAMLQKTLFDYVLLKSKMTPKKLKKIYKSKQDYYFNVETALELGVIDEVI